ncbi:MAG: DegT/DnrJ/EryC1/StrS aminotransferase family protein [Arcobacter butzleri]|jgi:dTDP-4-amino-4,6-dideoxygalactose transaminase|nr:DegT/DnrJ/EryC1/StrS aminotransferase family protein [Arcobacteraceae bacterium]MDY0365028.1 DegT/DnrJ/EryC1/StrS aminotransferase family protein [Arcobacteraceae bacterium]NLO16901.1 DegT/DnrJ/EryC1/StrS aminotransferase family protein [Aliarcobacter butzleri]
MFREIPFYKPLVGKEEIDQIDEVLELDGESKVEEFEAEIANFVGAEYAISTCNATAALHLALSAMDLKRGDKIVMSVNSFANVPEVVRHFDAEPIFIDIDPSSMNIDLDKLEEYLSKNKSKKLRGAIISFIAGQTPDLDKLYEIVSKYKIVLIEDATNALGVSYKDETIGSLKADMTIFSMNPSNGKSSISNGGVIITNNEEYAQRAKLLRTHAISTTYDDYGNLDYIYDVIDIGYKYDMSELEAAFSLAQLQKTNKFIKRRKEIAAIYAKRLEGIKHVSLPSYSDEHIFTQFIIKISKNRDAFARALKEEGVSTGLHFIPLHLLSYYKHKYNLKVTSYLNALNSYQQILSLPIYPSLSDDDVNYICDKVISIANKWI